MEKNSNLLGEENAVKQSVALAVVRVSNRYLIYIDYIQETFIFF